MPFRRFRKNFSSVKNLHGSAFRLHGTDGNVQVFERQTVLQSVTEFAWFRVNGLQRLKICPFKKFSGSLSTECKWHRAVVELSVPVFFRF